MAIKVLVISSYEGPLTSVRPEAEMVLGLKHAGVDISVMTGKDTFYARKFEQEGMTIYPYEPGKKIAVSEIRYIRKVLKEGNYDIVHVFNNRAVTNTVFASLGLPVKVVTYRGFTGHVLWYKPSSYISHLHPKVSKITCVSNGVRDQVRDQLAFNKEKAVTIYKGHNNQWYENIEPISKEKYGIPENSFVVGCIANVRRMKGIIYLLQATHFLKKHKDIHFLLIGKGMDNHKFMGIINSSPLSENIHLLGFRDDVLNCLKACNVSALPSIKGEGLSKVTIESMSLGVPVIATDVGGNSELVISGRTGKLIPPRSPEKIASAIIDFKRNQDWTKELGKNAQKHIKEHFHVDKTVRNILEMYNALIDKAG
ncbi:MAG: glycosyltransferase family 4 protein [Bacteroidales bacterium]